MEIHGICTCKNDTWKWDIQDGVITLTCTKCGTQAHFGVPFPTLDVVSDALDRKPAPFYTTKAPYSGIDVKGDLRLKQRRCPTCKKDVEAVLWMGTNALVCPECGQALGKL